MPGGGKNSNGPPLGRFGPVSQKGRSPSAGHAPGREAEPSPAGDNRLLSAFRQVKVRSSLNLFPESAMSVIRFAPFRCLCLLSLALALFASSAVGEEPSPTAEKEANVIRRTTEFVDINASWPIVGIARVDDESRAFVTGLADRFEQEIEALAAEPGVEEIAHLFPYELSISHEATYPSPRVASILWNIWSFTGGAHGMLDIVANNYDRSTGYPLLLEDLFVDPDLAVLQFSKAARRVLAEPDEGSEDGAGIPDEMLMAGTEPVEDNFRTFIVIPSGIRLHFQPYQVAPWAAWPQTVDVSLDELQAAKPNPEFWDAEAPAGETSKP